MVWLSLFLYAAVISLVTLAAEGDRGAVRGRQAWARRRMQSSPDLGTGWEGGGFR